MPTEIKTSRFHARRSVVLAAAALILSLGSPVALAASGDQSAKSHHARVRVPHAIHRSPMNAQARMLPYGPEYGFLRRVPPDAIVTPGYTFVPGVGILGESCDLPTSACPNQYRDIQ